MEQGLPYAIVDAEHAPDELVLQAGEQALLPVEWMTFPGVPLTVCSTHPDAPSGLEVTPGVCPDRKRMALKVENTSSLPVTITQVDRIAIGVEEGCVPEIAAYAKVQAKQNDFRTGVDWKFKPEPVEYGGQLEDDVRELESEKGDKTVLAVRHCVPRFASCQETELPPEWQGYKVELRVSHCLFEDGTMDYRAELPTTNGQLPLWYQPQVWAGRTVFVLDKEPEIMARKRLEAQRREDLERAARSGPLPPPEERVTAAPEEELAEEADTAGEKEEQQVWPQD